MDGEGGAGNIFMFFRGKRLNKVIHVTAQYNAIHLEGIIQLCGDFKMKFMSYCTDIYRFHSFPTNIQYTQQLILRIFPTDVYNHQFYSED